MWLGCLHGGDREEDGEEDGEEDVDGTRSSNQTVVRTSGSL